jgi:phage gp29-like protein
MADTTYKILDPYGRPIVREALTREIAGPTVTGVRSPYSGYPGDGLNPARLANILREADAGDPLRFFELAEQIEERDLHYTGVLGTRKRSVAQLDIQVDAAEDTPEARAHADWVKAGLDREELQSEIFDMLDAIGKGISFTEIVWDTSEGDWNLGRLIWRDPRWFRFDRRDGATPLTIGGYDTAGVGTLSMGDSPFPAFKFITTVIRAKSGLPIRSGIARLATWSWMFKAFTLRDWAIFAQTFGQPVRVGKYPAGSTEADKDTLFRAVANIAGDCAAIIPESMTIDFIEAANVGASHTLYRERADWLDQQTSKAVLGQTATTDAIAGGHAVGKEHRQVQEDIERADAKALSAVLNRDLVPAWVQLQFGPQRKYPRLRIGREEEENLSQTIDGVVKLVPLGLQVAESTMRQKLGLPEPKAGERMMVAPPTAQWPGGNMIGERDLYSMQSQRPVRRTANEIAALAFAAEQLTQPAFDDLVGEVRTALQSAKSLADIETHLKTLKLKPDNMAKALQLALVMAKLAGRDDLADAATS